MFPMTSETKILASILVLGPLDTQNIPFLSKNRQVFPLGKDKAMILYGIEQRMENDAEEALSHALALRSKDHKVYVSTQNVLFEDDMPRTSWNAAWDKTLDLLQKNEIGVSLDLVRIYQRVFDIHAKRLKDDSIFVLESKKEKPERIRGLQKKYSPLVGRKKELHTMLEVVEQSFEDQGQIASIIGDAGLGKTRLTAEFKKELEKKNIKYYEGFFSLNSDLNFRGFHQLVQQILESNTETFSKWNLTDSESAFLKYFLHPEEKNDIVKDLNEDEQTQGIFHSIQKLFSTAGQNPIVLILDDFHWAGDKSVKLMDLLSQSIEKTKIAFFLIHRQTFIPSFQKRLNYHQIKLSPLVHDETKELVKNALKLNYVTDSAIQTLTNLSLGNPLYVEEVLRELIAQKKIDIQKEEDIVRLIEVEFPKGAIPTNIHSLITARLDLLPKEQKEILSWACAFGFRENHDDFELFLQTLQLSIESFQKLFEQDYLEEASMFPEHKYKFKHDLLYETIKQSIPNNEWNAKNQKIADFLHQVYQNEMIIHGDRIAEFYIKGLLNEQAFQPIFLAAKIALDQKRYSTSMKYFESCSKLYPVNNKAFNELDFFPPYLDAIFLKGDTKEENKATLTSWEKTGFSSEESKLSYYKYLLLYLSTYREVDEAMKLSEQLIETYSKSKYQTDVFNFRINLFKSLVYKFNFAEAAHIGLKLLRDLNNSKSEDKVDILFDLGFVTQQCGFPNIGSYLTLTAKNISDESSNQKLQSKVYQRIAYLAVAQGYYKEASKVWDTLSHLKQQTSFPIENFRIACNKALVKYFLGEYKNSIEAMKDSHLDKNNWNFRWAMNWIGQVYLLVGSFANAKKVISDFRYFYTRDPYIRCNLLYVTANYHYQLGEYKKAKIFYRYAKNFYLKKEQKIYGYQMQLFELRCKLLLKEVTPEEATKEFDFIISHEEMRKYFYEWNTQMLSFWFARHGCNTRFKPSEEFDPMKCNAVYLRMMMFVEKIKWLQYTGKPSEAEKLKDQYLKHRQEMAFYVPDEFKKSYLEHPFYQV